MSPVMKEEKQVTPDPLAYCTLIIPWSPCTSTSDPFIVYLKSPFASIFNFCSVLKLRQIQFSSFHSIFLCIYCVKSEWRWLIGYTDSKVNVLLIRFGLFEHVATQTYNSRPGSNSSSFLEHFNWALRENNGNNY